MAAIAAVFFASRLLAADGFVRTAGAGSVDALQTADVTLRHASGVTVTLVSTIHYAEPAYFDSIRRDLAAFDVILHEGVAGPPTNATSPPAPPATMPRGLVRQVDALPLQGDRFVRADAHPAELDRLLAATAPAVQFDRPVLAAAACRIDGDPAWRERVDQAYAIKARNAIAVEALRHRLARGDRSVALIYGAAHAADLQARVEALGFVIESKQWRTAMTFSAPAASGASAR